METSARHRRSKSAASVEGILQIHRKKTAPKLPSYSAASTMENVLQDSLKQGSGTAIKKLLANEMAKENEARRRQPSVVARLMGLDGMPSPQPGHKQQRRLLEKHQQQNASVNASQPNQPHETRSSRTNSMDQQDFKDVYEDMEASHVMNHRSSSKWTANIRLLKPEITHLQQRCNGRRYHSSNEEFNGSLEILDSRKELLLKYLEEPDSVFLKHYHNLRDDPSSSPYDFVSSFEPSNSTEHQGKSEVCKSTKDGSYKRDTSIHKKREDGLLLRSRNYQGSRDSSQASKSQTSVNDDPGTLTTRIVLLKPNLAKGMNATHASPQESLHASFSASRKRSHYKGSGTEDILSSKTKTSSREVSSKAHPREGKDISNGIKRKIAKHLRPCSAGLRGYAGDESSYDVNDSDSSSASEIISYRNSFDGSNWVRGSSPGPHESLVSREAKKRLSDRWKITYKCQSVEPVAKGSTLGEMLAVSEKDSVHLHLDKAIERFTASSDSSGQDVPRGISSRDGWKDRRVGSFSPERSLSLEIGSRNHNTVGRKNPCANDVVKEKNKGKMKSRKGDLKKGGDYSDKNDSFGSTDSHSSLSKSRNNGNPSRDISSSSIQANVSSGKEIDRGCSVLNSRAPHITDSCRRLTADEPNAQHETLSLFSFPALCAKHDGSPISCDDSTARNKDITLENLALVKSSAEAASLECEVPEPESYESSKEADHCSPVSVLEVSFTEDVEPSPDSFETVSAEINGLRLKLQLLKMESRGYPDSPMISSKVDGEKQIVGGDDWESSYIVDVLLYSGLEEFDPDTLDLSLWHSPECAIGPWVFNSLEMKYNDEKTGELKSERRLLFDRINAAFQEMFNQYLNQPYLLQPTIIKVPKWQKQGIKDYLLNLLVRRDYKVGRKMDWTTFGDCNDTTGEDIEKLLIDELIGEVVTLLRMENQN